MLNDDISKGISGVVRTTGRIVASSLRGALMFGALAVIGVALAVVLTGPVLTALTTTGLGAGIGALANLFTDQTLSFAAHFFIPAAAAGAVTFGVTSLIPGISEGFGLKKLFQKKADPASIAPTVEPVVEPGLVPIKEPQATIEMENSQAQANHVANLEARRAASAQQAALASAR